MIVNPLTIIVFPAHAGMSRLGVTNGYIIISFPRTRGDEPSAEDTERPSQMFSPHTRG